VKRAASLVAIAAFCIGMQLWLLPPHGFMSGDQGSKYLQARAFASHGLLHPGIDVRSRDLDPDYRHQEPKLKNRQGRLVSEFLWLLPLTTAPFLAALGLHGLYVVPAISVLVIFLVGCALGRRMLPGDGLWAGWTVVVATPILLYGLELWEHAPAAACVLLATALFGPWSPSTGKWRFAGAGALILAAGLFREEALPALPALIVARALSLQRDRLRDIVVTSLWAFAGVAAVALMAVPMNVLLYGTPLPMHLTQDAWDVARATPFMEVRRRVLFDLLLPTRYQAVYAALAVGGVLASMLKKMGAVHACVAALLCISVVIPLARQDYNVASAAHTWPFVVALLYWPWARTALNESAGRFLMLAGALFLLLAALIVPTSGGAQWSPRFLLAVAPLLGVVAGAIAWQRTTIVIALMASAAIIAAVLMQGAGILYLRDAKARNARITDQLRALVPPDEPIIADAYWVPEVAATLAPDRRLLFAWSPADVEQIAGLAARSGFRNVAVVTSIGETGYAAPRTFDASIAGCVFTRTVRLAVGERGLIVHRYACTVGGVLR